MKIIFKTHMQPIEISCCKEMNVYPNQREEPTTSYM